MQPAGAVACVALAVTPPVGSVIAGLAMFGVVILYRVLRLRLGRSSGATGS